MKLKLIKIVFIIIFILVCVQLTADQMKYIFGLNTAAYFPELPNYKFDQPILGLHTQLDLFNLIGVMGIGGHTFQKVYSLDDRFSILKTYNAYLHSFSNYSTDDSYFTYGFYGGVKRTEIEYDYYKTSVEFNLTIHRALLGFRFASEKWGMDINWTQAENKKPILGYGLKFRNSNGMIMRIGRINRGVVNSISSEMYLIFGFELFK